MDSQKKETTPESIVFLTKLVRQYQERLTARGRYLLWVLIALSLLGLDTLRSQIYVLFGVVAGLAVMAVAFALVARPNVRMDCFLPQRATARAPVNIRARLVNTSGKTLSDLQLSFPRPRKWGSSIAYTPKEYFLGLDPDESAEFATEFLAARRGRYLIRPPAVRLTDPLRLATSRETALDDQTLLVYPRFYSMESFIVPVGRRYQPGGIPLSSSTGDAIEFVGTREYREGDPVKNIHWRSWARRGEPVVKEYEEEYFCRIALILDTFLPPHPRAEHTEAFEAAISVVASIADYFSRSEYIVDIMAAGPDIYEVSAGRSLAYLENILDVLACLEPCAQPPFHGIGPHLFEKLAQITTVVAILLDWDEPREDFLRRVKSLGTSVRALVVHEGETRKPWQSAGEDLGEVSQLAPSEVERLLAAQAAPSRAGSSRETAR